MRIYNLFVSPSAFKELAEDIWSEELLKGRFFTGNEKYLVKLGLRGHHIRTHRKKSYDILFIHPHFQGVIKELHLNGEYSDPSLIRNKLSFDFFRSIGVLAPEAEHVLLYINGKFQGIYLQLEAFNRESLKKRNLPEGPIFYAINDDANFSLLTAEEEPKPALDEGYMQKFGKAEDARYLFELLAKINTLAEEEFERQIPTLINIDTYLRWLAGAVVIQNFDGFVHNYALYRNSESGLFEIIPWDYDGTWGRDLNGDEMEADYVPIEGYNTLTARILACSTFRHKYREILAEILDHSFTPEVLAPKIWKLLTKIEPYINKDPYLKNSRENFKNEYNYILTFIKNRNHYLKDRLHTLN